MKRCSEVGDAVGIDKALGNIRLAAFWITLAGAAFSISLASVGGVVYAAALLIGVLRRSSDLPSLPSAAGVGAFYVLLGLSVGFNHFPPESAQGLLKYTWGFLVLYAGSEVLKSRRQWMALAGWLLFCEGLAAVSGIGQDFIGRCFLTGQPPVLYTDAITRITGPFKHCNDFATFLIPGWLFGCSLVIARIRRRHAVSAMAALIFTLIIGWAMARTMSRGAMIGAGAGMVILALTLPYRRWMLAAMSVCVSAAWLIPSPLSARLQQMLELSGSLQERIFLIRGALKMVAASPWLGLGPNTYSRWFPIYNPPDPSAPVLMYTHNSYLQIATEIGWLGLGLYLILIMSLLIRSMIQIRQNGKESEQIQWIRVAALASVMGLLVNALFESLLQSTQLRTLFWSLLGLSIANVWGLVPSAASGPGPAASQAKS
jgi:O-antigen ligase